MTEELSSMLEKLSIMTEELSSMTKELSSLTEELSSMTEELSSMIEENLVYTFYYHSILIPSIITKSQGSYPVLTDATFNTNKSFNQSKTRGFQAISQTLFCVTLFLYIYLAFTVNIIFENLYGYGYQA